MTAVRRFSLLFVWMAISNELLEVASEILLRTHHKHGPTYTLSNMAMVRNVRDIYDKFNTHRIFTYVMNSSHK
jgi:hypothetical protein